MYTLILIISLHSQFNHSLDIKYLSDIKTIGQCQHIANISKNELRKKDSNVEINYSCEQQLSREYK